MKVYVNDEHIEVAETSNISQLLSQIKSATKGIAIAIDQEIIPSNQWDSHQLKENDKVLLIRATQGG